MYKTEFHSRPVQTDQRALQQSDSTPLSPFRKLKKTRTIIPNLPGQSSPYSGPATHTRRQQQVQENPSLLLQQPRSKRPFFSKAAQKTGQIYKQFEKATREHEKACKQAAHMQTQRPEMFRLNTGACAQSRIPPRPIRTPLTPNLSQIQRLRLPIHDTSPSQRRNVQHDAQQTSQEQHDSQQTSLEQTIPLPFQPSPIDYMSTARYPHPSQLQPRQSQQPDFQAQFPHIDSQANLHP
jgi:hypothetical protein